MEPGVWKGKRSVLVCHTRCKCSMETTHNSVKVKLVIKVIKIGGKSDRSRSHCWSRSECPYPVSSLHIYTFVVPRALIAGAASQAGDTDSSRAPGLTSGLQGP